MPAPLKYYNVNWINGMKIRKDHFIQQENAFEDRMKDVAACFLNGFNYGLLPTWGSKDTSSKVIMKISNQKFLNISISQFRALTQGGARIEILEDSHPVEFSVDLTGEIEASKKEENRIFFIMLTVDQFSKEPFGELEAHEDPPRFPFTRSGLKVNLIPEKQVSREGIIPYSVFIGKILIGPDRVELFDEYLPACMTLKSHSRLIIFHSTVEKFYNQMELNILSIISKIKEKGQDSTLAQSVLNLAQNLLSFLSNNNLKLRWQLIDQPPLYLFENIASFARIVRNTIDSNTAAHKEELLNYFTNWSELKQGDFEKLLVYCINFEYNHNEISVNIDQFSEFVQIMTSLFTKLESLAYIGKKKETNIFVKEQTAKRSFLAD
jgi:hypothetical protein